MNTRDEDARVFEGWLRHGNATDTIRDIEARLASVLTPDELDTYIQWRIDQHDRAKDAADEIMSLSIRAALEKTVNSSATPE